MLPSAATAGSFGGASKKPIHRGGAQKNGKGAAAAHAVAVAQAQYIGPGSRRGCRDGSSRGCVT